MYTEHFRLKQRPFDLTPDPSLLYLNNAYNEALAVLRYGVSARKGFTSLVGEAGTGKTTVLRRFVADLGHSVKSVFVFNPSIGFEEMLAFVLDELGVQVPRGAGKLELLQALNDFLLAELRNGGNVVVLIDEAQDLRPEVLEELRLLSNLETDKEKILQIVFAGQPEFEEKLRDASLRQLRQRIALRARLVPLTRRETAQYVQARLRAAGAQDLAIFSAAALRAIWRASKGIPRLVNLTCDSSLVAAYASARRRVTSRVVREVLADMAQGASPKARPAGEKAMGRLVLAAAVSGAMAGAGLVIMQRMPEAMDLAGRTARWVEDAVVPSGLWAQPGGEGIVEDYIGARTGGVGIGNRERVAQPLAGVPPAEKKEEEESGRTADAKEDEPLALAARSGEVLVAVQPEARPPQRSEGGTATLASGGERESASGATEENQVAQPRLEENDRAAGTGSVAADSLGLPAQREGEVSGGENGPAGDDTAPVGTEVVPVRPGDTLTELAARRYGRVSFTLLDAIKSANPAIGDIDLIWAGQNLVLPAVDGAIRVRQEEDGTYAAWVVSAGSLQVAQEYVRELGDAGFAGRISLVSTDAGQRARFVRIWVTGFASAEEADRVATRLRSELERKISR